MSRDIQKGYFFCLDSDTTLYETLRETIINTDRLIFKMRPKSVSFSNFVVRSQKHAIFVYNLPDHRIAFVPAAQCCSTTGIFANFVVCQPLSAQSRVCVAVASVFLYLVLLYVWSDLV